MNTQDILRFFGTKLSIKLDSSEYYDYQLGKNEVDYNTDVLDLTTPITYTSLKIDESLEDTDCTRTSITLVEYDNSVNDSGYTYSGLTTTVDYDNFVSTIDSNFENIILNDDIFTYTGLTDETHYFRITGFNETLSIDVNFGVSSESELLSGFTTNVIKCLGKLSSDTFCCPITSIFNNKPWSYQFKQNDDNVCTSDIISRRTEKGWTLDFVFNRESLSWSDGSVFYYFGVRGTDDESEYADNNLSFQFTSDGRIKWVSYHYSGYCETVSGYTTDYYISSGQTPQLCATGDTKDFNVTIVFDRYKEYVDCNLENDGGWNDLLGWQIEEYTDTEVSAVTSTQIVTYESQVETLNKKWSDERDRRLGVLKIYLNGRPIYKIDNWEEIVPSNRGTQPFIQSWGGGTNLMNDIHSGVCCFNMKSIKYYEEPLDFIHVRHNFLTRLGDYDFFICGESCTDNVTGL